MTALADRFWSHVRIGDGCWEWSAARLAKPFDYGVIGGVRPRCTYRAHRLSWRMKHRQPIPAGMMVLHHCDNPPCVRPSHLFLGTNGDNVRDMVAKGRHGSMVHQEERPRGESHGNARLTEEQVRAIRVRVALQHETISAIARDFKISRTWVRAVAHRWAWAHVGGAS